jgi:hypothetical protein
MYTIFGIRFNKNETFSGDIIKLFYEPTPGLYPRYLPNGVPQNGGLPQVRLIIEANTSYAMKVEEIFLHKN